MKKILQKYRLLNIGILFFALFFALPDASAQMVRRRKINRKFRKCSDIGKVKVKKTKMSRQMRQKLSARYANINLSYRSISKKSTSQSTANQDFVNQESINKNTASELSIANKNVEIGKETNLILFQKEENIANSQPDIKVISQKASSNNSKIIAQNTQKINNSVVIEKEEENTNEVVEDLEIPEKEKRSGNVWYISDEAMGDEISPLPFQNDDDDLSPADIEILKKAAAQVRYGFSLELQEHFNQEDIDSGKNISYKRANRLKSYLVHKLGVDANAIYLNSFFDNRKTDPKRIQIVIKN